MNAAATAAVELSVIVPAFNESERIAAGMEAIMAYLRSDRRSWELIVVDDGSTDETAYKVQQVIAAEPRARLIQYRPNRGKGFAVRTGVLVASGMWVVFLDADLSTPVEEIGHALPRLQAGVDLVIGSRSHPDARIERKSSFFRHIASAVFDRVRNAIVGLHQFSDTQCGFKAARGEAVRPLYQRAVIERFMFDVEIIYLAERAGLRMEEMPVCWADSPGSTVRFFPGVYEMFRDLLRIRRVHRNTRVHAGVATDSAA
jgi:dolichyl-phosphate beta-glucosyltransferase